MDYCSMSIPQRARAALAVIISRLLRGLLQWIVVFLDSGARWARHTALFLDSGAHKHNWNYSFLTLTHVATIDGRISRLPCAMRWTYCCIARLLCAIGQTYHRQLPTVARTEATSIYALDSAARQCSSLLQFHSRWYALWNVLANAIAYGNTYNLKNALILHGISQCIARNTEIVAFL